MAGEKRKRHADAGEQIQGQSESTSIAISCLKHYFETSKYTDLVIKCEGEQWKVHRAFVCAQSKLLERRVDKLRDFRKGEITLVEEDPQVVDAMIHFFYHSTYEDDGIHQNETPAVIFNIRVFNIAVEYSIPSLESLAARKFKHRCEQAWATSLFVDAISDVYEEPGMLALKSIAVETAVRHGAELFDSATKQEFEQFHEVLLEIAEFGADLSAKFAELYTKSKKSD